MSATSDEDLRRRQTAVTITLTAEQIEDMQAALRITVRPCRASVVLEDVLRLVEEARVDAIITRPRTHCVECGHLLARGHYPNCTRRRPQLLHAVELDDRPAERLVDQYDPTGDALVSKQTFCYLLDGTATLCVLLFFVWLSEYLASFSVLTANDTTGLRPFEMIMVGDIVFEVDAVLSDTALKVRRVVRRGERVIVNAR